MTVGNYKQTVSTILLQKRINLKTSLKKIQMLFMYLSCSATTNFPANAGQAIQLLMHANNKTVVVVMNSKFTSKQCTKS